MKTLETIVIKKSFVLIHASINELGCTTNDHLLQIRRATQTSEMDRSNQEKVKQVKQALLIVG